MTYCFEARLEYRPNIDSNSEGRFEYRLKVHKGGVKARLYTGHR